MVPIPLRDDNPRTRFPVVTLTLIALNVAVWLFELAHGPQLSALDYGAIPAWLLHHQTDGTLRLPGVGLVELHQELPWPWTLLAAMFLHGSWLHLLGNMWFLWVFGDNVEEAMGRARFVAFYLVCGLLATAAHIAMFPSTTAPMVGASGAIAGVLGGYALLFPRARVRCLWILIIFITTVDLPAWLLLGVWLVSQFLVPTGSGIAAAAHVGGFVCGLALVRLFTLGRGARRPRTPSAFTPARSTPSLRWSDLRRV